MRSSRAWGKCIELVPCPRPCSHQGSGNTEIRPLCYGHSLSDLGFRESSVRLLALADSFDKLAERVEGWETTAANAAD
jgi:hypothetical protein